MGFGNSKNKKKENPKKENEINKVEKKSDDEKNRLEKEEEIKQLRKDLTQKNEKVEEEEEEEEICIEEFEEEEEEENKRKEEKIIFKNENEAKHLEVKFKIQLNKEKDEIYKIYELSDNRIAVELDNCIKIYSLKTYQLIKKNIGKQGKLSVR